MLPSRFKIEFLPLHTKAKHDVRTMCLILLLLNVLFFSIHASISLSSCSCEVGSYFTAPNVQNIYECNGNDDAAIVESWDECMEIGPKCTDPVIVESECYLQLSGEMNEKGGTYRALLFETPSWTTCESILSVNITFLQIRT